MPSILFVCMANRFRSPLAAALFRQQLERRGLAASWTVSSAGMWAGPGLPAAAQALAAAQRYRLDLSGHRTRQVDRRMLAACDLVLVMQESQREALLTEFPGLHESLHLLSQAAEGRTYDIPDPCGDVQSAAEAAAGLDDLLRCGFESICALASSLYNSKDGPGEAVNIQQRGNT